MLSLYVFGLLMGLCHAGGILGPKPMSVSCMSLNNNGDFKQRLKFRTEAEDQTTIWLFGKEELTIKFEVSEDSSMQVLDIRYSNDGDTDVIGVTVDDQFVGQFVTDRTWAWGFQWNKFRSSGPLGTPVFLEAGKHSLSVNIMESDDYGVELDYIRLNVNGAVMLNKEDFLCVHKQDEID